MIERESNGTVPIEDIRTLMIESRTATVTAYALSALSAAGVCVYLCVTKSICHAPCYSPWGNIPGNASSYCSSWSRESLI